MTTEKEIDLSYTDDSEYNLTEESEEHRIEILDERDYIQPSQEAEDVLSDPTEENPPMPTYVQADEKIELPQTGADDQTEASQAEIGTQIRQQDNEEQNKDDSELPPPEGNFPPENMQAGLPEEIAAHDLGDSDGHSLAEKSPQHQHSHSEPHEAMVEGEAAGEFEEAATEETEYPETLLHQHLHIDSIGKPIAAPKVKQRAIRLSSFNIIISLVLAMMIGAGIFLYYHPSVIGLTKKDPSVALPPVDPVESVTPVSQPVATPAMPSKRDQCLAKIEEADLLRKDLLGKKEEIAELERNYRNGIAELEDEIRRGIKQAGINTFTEVMENKSLVLKLRTIQRRQAYIKELTKPAYWLNLGSEELNYLVRKAQVDLQLTGIAGGVDLNKHMRHISAAIQKYHPGSDKLTVDPAQSEIQPLETIWEKIFNKKDHPTQVSLNSKDQAIINQICSGNFDRIAELTRISMKAAGCLSRIEGANLLLNSLTTLSADAAKQLFQWSGNWICLNSVKQLPPAVAQHLFQWKGNWISLNGLDEFPPESAMSLLKWEGQQLELMGLKSNKNTVDQKTLKYLALWETTGGKLFVNDEIRQEMESLM